MGQGQANLAAAGIDIKAIDAVVISHFHGDHINGLVTDGKPSYPERRGHGAGAGMGRSGWTTAT